MLNRRNAVKMGAAGLAGLAPAALVERARSATDPIPDAIAEKPWHTPEVYDPAAFAMRVVSTMGEDLYELWDHEGADGCAGFRIAMAALMASNPDLGDVPFDHPVVLVDEAATSWAGSAFDAGVRLGAAIEQMRRTWIAPLGVCPRCQGKGGLGPDGGYGRVVDGPPCGVCAGSGVLARG